MTLINGPTFSSTYGGYINFVATSSQYANTSTSLTSTPNWTVEVWHYYTGSGNGGTNACIVSQNFPGTTSAIQFFIGYSASTNFGTGFFNGSFYQTSYYTPPTTNKWYHIVGNYTGSALNLYINGCLVQTTATSATAASNGAGFKLMGRWDAPAQADYWGGGIAVFRIYNRPLVASEVNANFNAERGRFGI
jgi:hypothetical protein